MACISSPPGPVSARRTGPGVREGTVWTLACGHLEAGGPDLVLDFADGWCVSEGGTVMDLGAYCEVLELVCECRKILASMEGRARPNGLRLVPQPK